MSSNPYSKFIIDPSTVPDPNKVTLSQFEKYSSLEMEKIGSVFRTLKRSSFYIGGVIGLCFVGALWAERRARCELFGGDNKGGSYLDLQTVRDEAHYAYNREFQRMFHLAEGAVADRSIHSEQYLADLGVNVAAHGSPKVPKRPAHQKYY